MLANETTLNFKYHTGLKQFFNINLGIGIIEKTTFLFVFSTYLPVFLLKFQSGDLPGCEINSASNEYPLGILLMDLATPKTRNA